MFKSFWRSEKGQSMVEFSVSLPVLLLIIAGILEFSRLGSALLLVNFVARRGRVAGGVVPRQCPIRAVNNPRFSLTMPSW